MPWGWETSMSIMVEEKWSDAVEQSRNSTFHQIHSVEKLKCSGTCHFKSVYAVLVLCAIIACCLARPAGASIGCFKCFSVNGSNPYCEDPFHNNFSSEFYETPCLCGRKGRDGLFPGTSCIKIKGTVKLTGKTILYRTCSLDSGTQTTDTEIVRMSHCGHFEFDDEYLAGCVQSCNDADGCNGGRHLSPCYSFYQNVFLICLGHRIAFWILFGRKWSLVASASS